jgi:hypothetical protein
VMRFWATAEAGTPIPASPTRQIAEVTRSRGRELQAMDRSCIAKYLEKIRCDAQHDQVGRTRLKKLDDGSLC